jgi:hypothetical protein
MKLKIPISWHFDTQEEKEVIVDIPETVAKRVVTSFLMHKDYQERRDWLKKNVSEISLNTPKELF